MIAYLDSSAIIKHFLLDEPGLEDLLAVARSAPDVTTSRLSYVEVRAGLAAARRAQRLDAVEHDRAVASLDTAWPAYSVVEVSEAVCLRAGSIAAAFRLRAGDSIQLASILEFDPVDVVMVAWDVRLRAAATAAGLAVYPADV